MNSDFEADILQVTVLKMLGELQNVEKLTFGRAFLQILSLAELRGVSFPMLKVKALTFQTRIFQYVIPSIKRLLQNSPDLETLTLLAMPCGTIQEGHIEKYLKSRGLNSDQRCRLKDGVSWNKCSSDLESMHIVSFVELVHKNTKTLAKMVVLLDERFLRFKVKELVQRLSHYNNIAIKPYTHTDKKW